MNLEPELLIVALAQLGAIVAAIFKAGRYVQKFEDHLKEDNRRFEILEQRAGIAQPLRSPS